MRRAVVKPFAGFGAAVVGVTVVVAALTVPMSAHADEVRDEQWHIEALGLDEAHELSRGRGVTIGLIDSGVDANHPDLEGNVEAGRSFGDAKGGGLIDERGHGTQTASLLVGHGHGSDGAEGVIGVAPEARLISVAVRWRDSSRYDGDGLSKAIGWLVDRDVDVISISMGMYTPDAGGDAAIKAATDAGIPVVAAVGNREPDYDPALGESGSAQTARWPARATGAIPVTATTRDQGFLTQSLTLTAAATKPRLGVSAPGEKLMTAKNGGGYDATKSGTSLAAPLVTGTLALLTSAYPNLDADQRTERLLRTADDKGLSGFDDKFGWGIVNPYRALTEDVEHAGGGASTKADLVPLDGQGSIATPGDTDAGIPDDIAVSMPTSLAILVPAVVVALGIGLMIVKRRRARAV